MAQKLKHRRKLPDAEVRQASLERLGYVSYRQYLAGALWREIRRKVLDRDKTCRICKEAPPTQVHHYRYTFEVMKGKKQHLKYLIGVCRECHEGIEFEDARKRAPEEVRAETRRLQRS